MRKTLQNLRKISGIILSLLIVMSTIPFSVSASVAFIGDFRYDFNDTNYTAAIRDYLGNAENVTVPATVSYLGTNYVITEMDDTFKNNTTVKTVTVSNGIKSIDYYSFLNCTNLTSVTIPESVTKIGTGAFDGCSKLASVTIPKDIITIGDGAFNKCTNLTSITIPDNVTTIGNNAFDRCSSLSSVDIGSKVENIGNFAFYGTALTEVIIPDSVITIGNNAFDHCSSLSSVDIGSNVESIGTSAFSYSALTEVIIPDSVITIGNNAFDHCYSLANVDFGNGVQSIGTSAFSYSALTEVIIPDSVTTIGGVAFCYCNSFNTLILPNGLPNLTTVGNVAFGYTDITNIFVKDGVDTQSNIYDKLQEETFTDKARVWKYREDGTTAGGKIKATIVSVESKDGTALSEENGILLSADSMGNEYEIVSIEQVKCFKENLEGGASKDPKEWTVYVKHNYGNTWETNETDHWQKCTVCKSDNEKAPHNYNNGYVANPDGTHSPKCECGAINESVKEAHNWIGDTDDNHKCSYCKQTASHRWYISSIKEVTDKELGEIEYECSDCGTGKIRPIPPLEENRNMLLLTQSITKGEEKIACVVQDPYEVLPNGVRLDSSISEGSALLSNNANLDNTHKIEHVEFFEINLSEPTAAPISQLNAPVRVLLQIPKGWDKSEIEVVRVNVGIDMEFEESIVTIDEIDYVAFWTDHFSPYAMIDKLVLSNIKDVSDVSKTYDGTAVANPTYTYDGDGQITIKWYVDDNGIKGDEINRPTHAGIYWVGVSVSTDGTYNAASEVTKQFTIKKATQNIDKEPTTTEEDLKNEKSTKFEEKQNEDTAIPKTETNSPKTGDNRNMALWIALLFAIGIGIVPITVYGRKKRQAR